MKVTVSYISSKYDFYSTIEKIDNTSADAIHADLMDGKYVTNSNFEIGTLVARFKKAKKPIDVHLMTIEPEKYLSALYAMNTNIIFFHPSSTKNVLGLIDDIKDHGKKCGIVINPTEDIKEFSNYFPLVDAVLLMSVEPGKGGQRFLRESLVNYEFIKEIKENYIFELYIDGGINDETISYIRAADGVVSGSFICNSLDYEEQIQKLKNKCL